MLETISAFWAEYGTVLTTASGRPSSWSSISTVFAYLIGVPLGVALIVTQPQGIRPHRGIYRVLDWIVNIGRSIPFIILMVALMPFTRLVVGTTIGVKGAIPPLVISAAPFIARMVETSLSEVDAGVVEAAQSMGASTLQIVWKVYLPEAKPSLILGGAISLVTILAYTAIAGTVGAGGLGDIAVRYGHQRGITSVMWVTVVFLIILVQVVQLGLQLAGPGASTSGWTRRPTPGNSPLLSCWPSSSTPSELLSFIVCLLEFRQAFEINPDTHDSYWRNRT